MNKSYKFAAAIALNLAFIPAAHAVDLDGYGTLSGDLRLRYEQVQQDGKAHDANAQTFRARLGYLTPTWEGLSGFGEVETIRSFGPGAYYDGINNGYNAGWPGISDPQDNAINQLYANYKNDAYGQARVGRQVITFDNQRWVGRSNWRQNDQTFDAVNLSTSALFGWNLAYVNSWRANRALGTRADGGRYSGDMNFFHAQKKLPMDFDLALYHYMHNFEDRSTLSSQTTGGRLLWNPKSIIPDSKWQPLAAGEVALQRDYGNNPLNYNQYYQSYELGVHKDKLKFSGQFDSLGGNGTAAVQTPTASNHCQTGCVDKFTTTPVRGLQDYKVQTTIPLPFVPSGQSLTADGSYHYFTSVVHNQHYGNEVDATLNYSPWEGHTITASVGRYAADQLMTDTVKYWLAYELKF